MTPAAERAKRWRETRRALGRCYACRQPAAGVFCTACRQSRAPRIRARMRVHRLLVKIERLWRHV